MMKYTKFVIKNKLFKKPTIEIPEEVLCKCVPVKSDSKDKTIYIGICPGHMELRAKLPPVDDSVANISLYPKSEKACTYKEVLGFFSFRGDIFYRVKGSAGKSVKTGSSFTDFIKEKYPDEFGKCKVSDISALEVMPLEAR